MGALHAGHISLVEAARKKAQRVVVSIFVNPIQFAVGEDFGAYPRTFAADVEKLAQAGADACFAPTAQDMYPDGFATTVNLAGPAQAGLEDRFRPTHFAGVATVVAKLLNQAQADFALFGEKDFQQLAVIARMARDLDIPTEILGVATMREADGLAMSSRNVYLSAEQRAIAPELYRALSECAQAVRVGGALTAAVDAARRRVGQAGFVIDYLEARHAESLAPVVSPSDEPIRLLSAARLGATRLIDNLAV